MSRASINPLTRNKRDDRLGGKARVAGAGSVLRIINMYHDIRKLAMSYDVCCGAGTLLQSDEFLSATEGEYRDPTARPCWIAPCRIFAQIPTRITSATRCS